MSLVIIKWEYCNQNFKFEYSLPNNLKYFQKIIEMVKHLYSIINMENQVKIKKRTDKISYRRRKKKQQSENHKPIIC